MSAAIENTSAQFLHTARPRCQHPSGRHTLDRLWLCRLATRAEVHRQTCPALAWFLATNDAPHVNALPVQPVRKVEPATHAGRHLSWLPHVILNLADDPIWPSLPATS